jgi:methionyl-tRNA formyltransferase
MAGGRLLFCGFGKLGRISLVNLLETGEEVPFVLTHNDGGADSVDGLCRDTGLDFSYRIPSKHLDDICDRCRERGINTLISVNYRFIIPKTLIALMKYHFNVHGSLLPKYRGRTPHVWAIINGEKSTGISSHLVDEEVDAGDIILQREVTIDDDDTGFSILEKFEEQYPGFVRESLDFLREGRNPTPQDHREASYFGRRTPEMGYIMPGRTCKETVDFIRAQKHPYPGAYYYDIRGNRVIIDAAERRPVDFHQPVGQMVFYDENFFLRCLDGTLMITEYRV